MTYQQVTTEKLCSLVGDEGLIIAKDQWLSFRFEWAGDGALVIAVRQVLPDHDDVRRHVSKRLAMKKKGRIQ